MSLPGSTASASSTIGVLAKAAQWTTLFEAKQGLRGEGGLGKPYTGDE